MKNIPFLFILSLIIELLKINLASLKPSLNIFSEEISGWDIFSSEYLILLINSLSTNPPIKVKLSLVWLTLFCLTNLIEIWMSYPKSIISLSTGA